MVACGALPEGDGWPLSRNGLLPIDSRALRASCPSLQPSPLGSTPLRLLRCAGMPLRLLRCSGTRRSRNGCAGTVVRQETRTPGTEAEACRKLLLRFRHSHHPWRSDAVAAASRWPWMANRPSGRPCGSASPGAYRACNGVLGPWRALRRERLAAQSKRPPAHRFAGATGLLPFAPAAPFGEHATAPASLFRNAALTQSAFMDSGAVGLQTPMVEAEAWMP